MADNMPKRKLGRTGWDASIIGLGGVMYNFLPTEEAAALVNRALDLGINYIDTASGYQESEVKIGCVMEYRRKEVFLATKVASRTAKEASEEMKRSFDRLQTDVIDLMQFHMINDIENLNTVLGDNGALKAVEELRDSGKVRYIGFSSHGPLDVIIKVLQSYKFAAVLMPLGVVNSVRYNLESVLPVAQELDVAVVGMKVISYGVGKEKAPDFIRYTLSLPISVAVTGVDNIEQLEQNVQAAKSFVLMTEELKEVLRRETVRLAESADLWWIPK